MSCHRIISQEALDATRLITPLDELVTTLGDPDSLALPHIADADGIAGYTCQHYRAWEHASDLALACGERKKEKAREGVYIPVQHATPFAAVGARTELDRAQEIDPTRGRLAE
jgi:hypothetical protein